MSDEDTHVVQTELIGRRQIFNTHLVTIDLFVTLASLLSETYVDLYIDLYFRVDFSMNCTVTVCMK